MTAEPAISPRSLSPGEAALALAVVVVWGTNFVVTKIALNVLPPLLFAALRFTFVLFPAIFFLKRPPVPWKNLAGYGLLIGTGQFGLLYIAMISDITPGLASLVLQTQVIFTIGLSIAFQGERAQLFQWVAVALAAVGLGIVAANAGGATTPLGLTLSLVAAFCWACGNLFSKQAGPVNMLAYVVWASLFSAPPLLLLSLAFEGPHLIVADLQRMNILTWGAVLWQSVGNALFGYTVWGWLLSRHPAATVAAGADIRHDGSAWWLSEPLPGWKLGAAALVLGGLAINMLWPLVRERWAR